MNEGWIKLFRKSKENPLMKDFTAWGIFSWILLTVDRATGRMTLGRKWASAYFSMKEPTFYKALKRLEKKYKVIALSTKKVTIKFTEVEVINWFKYQDSNNPVSIKEQSSNNPVTHIQEVENKELRPTVLKKPYDPIREFNESLARDLAEEAKAKEVGKA
jgi:hypothetical protein